MAKPRTFNSWRSGLEEKIAQELDTLGIPYDYEKKVIRYTPDPKERRYTPDFDTKSGIIIETKGYFVTADRLKHLMVKQQHPELDIRFIFSNSKTRISKQSKTTYGMWCEKHGFLYADRHVPKEWFGLT